VPDPASQVIAQHWWTQKYTFCTEAGSKRTTSRYSYAKQ